MSRSISHTRIYRAIVSALERSPLVRVELIEAVCRGVGLTKEELADRSAGSTLSNLRSRIGATVNQMHTEGLIGIDNVGRYFAVTDKPVVVRIERCEKEILSILTEKPRMKAELREKLKERIGTSKTVNTRDDDILSTYMGQILKRLLADGVLTLTDGIYALSPKISARADDVNEILALKSDFLLKLHSKGGEFFENFFVSLMKKYYLHSGKKVVEAYVTGGSDDGGIDGVIRTLDKLGFYETIMIQTKNRVDISSETEVRGFYGAVCAKRGSRGIFATTSDFHTSAKDFINGLDDLVGINGDRVFALSIECAHGIKKVGGKLEIDERIFI